jgi:hypothetical protein
MLLLPADQRSGFVTNRHLDAREIDHSVLPDCVTPSNYGPWTSGYVAEKPCREELLDLLSILPITHDKNPYVLTLILQIKHNT